MNPKKILALQSLLLAGCGILVAQFAVSFPFPGPAVRSFLPPRARWPEEQVRAWAKDRSFRQDYLDFFYRDPERTVPGGDNLIAPADGPLVYHDRKNGKQYLVIGLSLWDVHIQRFPCDGVVTAVDDKGDTFMDGEGKDFAYLRDKICPVQRVVSMRTKWGDLKIRLITSLSARRIEVWVKPGAKVAKGQRLGKILAGSTVVLEMPDTVPVLVKIKDRMVAGETILGGAR